MEVVLESFETAEGGPCRVDVGVVAELHSLRSRLLSGLNPPPGPLTLVLPGVSSSTLDSLVTLLYTGRWAP